MNEKAPNGEAQRSDGSKVVSVPKFFACNHETCVSTGTPNTGSAEDMFNLDCRPHQLTIEGLLRLVVCRRCAELIAKKRGLRLREPNCGTYPFKKTLELVVFDAEYRERRGREDQDYLEWMLRRQKERELPQQTKKTENG